MPKADIWMPFYVSDYLADTMHLTPAEHGAYLMLILHYWKTGPLPDDDARLALISRMGDAWSNASSTLRAFFKQSSGMLHHKRIDKEKAEAADNKARNQARATAAASKRWANHASSNASSNATSTPQAMLNECPSPSPSSSPSKSQLPKKAVARASRLPADFDPDRQFALSEGIADIDREIDKFRDYWNAQPGNKGTKLDWQGTWRNWCRNADKRKNQSTGETAYQRSMREKIEVLAPSIAARSPINPNTYFETLERVKPLEIANGS